MKDGILIEGRLACGAVLWKCNVWIVKARVVGEGKRKRCRVCSVDKIGMEEEEDEDWGIGSFRGAQVRAFNLPSLQMPNSKNLHFT
jgi:hypothetical protein